MVPGTGGVLLLVAAALSGVASAIFEEQVGAFEWSKTHVGAPSAAAFLKKAVLVGTEKGVIASLAVRNGAINWRHVLGAGDLVTALAATEEATATVSSDGMLRVWSSAKGVLQWEAVVHARGSAAPTSVEFFAPGMILVEANETVTALTSAGGSVAWTRPSPKGAALRGVAASAQDVCLVYTGEEVLVSCVAPTTGAELWSRRSPTSVSSLVAARDDAGVVLLVTSAGAPARVSVLTVPKTGALATRDHAVAALDQAAAATGGPFTLERAAVAGAAWLVAPRSRTLLVLSHDQQQHAAAVAADGGSSSVAAGSFKLATSALSAGSCPGAVALSGSGGGAALVAAAWGASGVAVTIDGTPAPGADESLEGGAADATEKLARLENGDIVRCFAVGSSAAARTKFVRSLIVTADHTVALLQGSRVLWTRSEWLASVTRVVALSPNLDDGASSEEPTFTQRLAMQWAALAHAASAAQAAIAGALGMHSAPSSNSAYRFDKIWVVYCGVSGGVGKLAGIDAETGAVTWSRLLSISNAHTDAYADSALRLLVTRAHSIGGHHSEVAVVGADAAGGAAAVYHFDATTGRPLGTWRGAGVFNAAVLLPLRVHGAHAVGVVSLSDGGGRVMDVVPEGLAAAAADLGDAFVMSLLDTATGELVGYQTGARTGSRLALRAAWTVQTATDGHEVAAVVRKDRDDPVDSPVTIRGDDSLLIKYVNPHLLAVVSVAKACATADDGTDTLSVMVIDTVSGRVRARVRHRTACGPAHAVMSDNWVVYSYWNAKARRTELGSLALYEGSMGPKDLLPFSDLPPALDTFSSFNDDVALVTYHKTFVLPASVSCLGVTRTRLGITSRNVLAALDSFSVLSIDRRLLDPRRPAEAPTEPEKLEGLIPYNAYLPLFHQAVLSHGSEVARTTLLSSAPAALESTTFVLASGLDVFFTRAMPSKSFDILDGEFNRGLLVALTGTLFMATVVLTRMSTKAQLAMQWK